MQNIMNAILANIELATAIVVAFGALVAAIVNEYMKVRRLLAEREFTEAITPIMAVAENEPARAYGVLATKPINDTPLSLATNQGKAIIVAQAALETVRPSVLKKLKINSLYDAIPMVTTVYQSIVKPIVKAIK